MAKPTPKKKHPAKQPTDFYQYANWILILLALICYLPVLNLDLTQLDDTVFINDKHDFISHFSNIPKAFVQGCFNEKDIYYRPMLLVYFILLAPFSSVKSIVIYHFGSVVFHAINVLLLYRLLNKLTGKRNHAFWLTAFFCVHPALTMAVAWIPGINDLLLTTFALGYFLSLLRIAEGGKWKDILINALFLLLALFTKESGAFLPLGGFLLLWYKGYLKDAGKKFSFVIPLTLLSWIVWFFARKNVLPENTPALINSDMVSLVLHRAAGLIQYFGKCILPFNLQDFPTIEGTNIIWGLAAIVLVAALVFQNKERNLKNILIGSGWFVLFLLPIFFVPKNINDQLFEHRLYLPMIGILLLLRETILFSSSIKVSTRQTIVIGVFVACVVDIHLYMPDFKDTFSFWTNAVAASPQNAYANKMLGIKMAENKRESEAIPYFEKAYELDSNERYTRLFIARLIYMPKQNWDSARFLLEREIEINPLYSDTYADLAQVCVAQKDWAAAEKNIVKFLSYKPKDQLYNNNLMLLMKEQGKYREALAQADTMKARGLDVNAGLYKAIADSVNAGK
ncbi:MAG: tetratricopeptide repeat protein [Bacteroidota bacterium]